jgi:hypothetical protein
MEESILVHHDKTTLKTMAVERGLTRSGFNDRNRSKMRKQDFIDFILAKEQESAENSGSSSIESTSESASSSEVLLEASPSPSEDEMINILEELFVDDSFQPIIRIMDVLYGFEYPDSERKINRAENSPERIPNEEDESVPNLSLQDLIVSKNICDIDCKCKICQININIVEENLKVQLNMRDLEARITCVICRCNVRNVIFNPCNHLASCIACSKNPLLDNKCPLCRKVYTNTNRVFC